MNSRHHDVDERTGTGKKPNSNKYVLVIVALVIFLMGIGMFFFVVVSDQPDESVVEPVEVFNL